jgi:hypothetical protein
MQHLVHLYQETRFLAEAVAEYLGESLRAGKRRSSSPGPPIAQHSSSA